MSERAPRSDLGPAAQSAVAAGNGLSLIALINILLRRRRLLLLVAGAAAIVTASYKLISPRTYTVPASFFVQSHEQGGAAGLAAQLGVNVGGIDVSQSPGFYAALLKTPDVLGRLVDTTFVTSDNATPRPLEIIWNVKGVDKRLRRAAVLSRLQAAISSSVGLRLDVVTLSVTTRDPLLSKRLADALLSEVNRFNLQTRQSRASAERRFAEGRMNEVRGELRVAEDALERFYKENRQPYLSAELELQKGRLSRRGELLSSTYTTLATAFERARIDEVRDTPLITLIQRPDTPVRADPRRLVRSTILMFMMGLIGGAVLLIVIEMIHWMRTSGDDESVELSKLLHETVGDVRKLRNAVPGLARREKAKG